MKYYSLNHKAPKVNFDQAVIKGIAPDKGLYFPERIPQLPETFWQELDQKEDIDIAVTLMTPFVGKALGQTQLKDILSDVLSFPFPIIPIDKQMGSLELFHGPTLAFKDVGARFMARCLSYFLKEQQTTQEVTVLVATSGDTGGAVARGFYKVPGINVVILYPSGKVSALQEQQLTTLGENITALEVDGSFDDCQAMVKQAFLDQDITTHRQLTSANSINVARWLPQMLYYVFAYKHMYRKHPSLVFSVPSGNFGNICAGMVAHLMGMPVYQFIAAVNSNTTIPQFMRTGVYAPKKTVATISNAMDVSDPSNFVRVLELFENDRGLLSKKLTSYSYCDRATRAAIYELYKDNDYIADPHGAIGYLGLKEFLKTAPNAFGLFLETAHPVKFRPAVTPIVGPLSDLPTQVAQLELAPKKAIPVQEYSDLKAYLLS
ncbi:MAG: threonine synthase [Dokdonia sp.]|jgi:threonine synthase